MHPYLRVELELVPAEGEEGRTAGRAPPLPAPLVRRILGKALVERHCPFGEPLCQPAGKRGAPAPPPPRELCNLAEACPYGLVFAGSRTARPPFSVYVPSGGEAAPRQRVEITLYGPAWQHFAWVLAGLRQAAATGAGRRRESWRLHQVHRLRPDRRRQALAGADLAGLPSSLEPDLLGLGLEPYLAPQPVTVELLSPARLLVDGRLLRDGKPVPFQVLIARILDRFRGLYGEGASAALRPEIRPTLEAEAERVPLLEDSTHWIEVPDYSARSGTEMLMGGKVGRLVYGDGASRFLPILRAGEILHLGKNPTAGCGRIQVDLPRGP